MQAQDSVKVINDKLDAFDQAGRVVCSVPYDVAGESTVDVELDLERGTVYQFAVTDLRVL